MKGGGPMKKLMLIGCALVVVVAAVVYFSLSNLGPIIRQAVNTYGPGITQTDVRLGDAGLSLFSGEVKLEDFLVGNPQGFKSSQAIKVARIYVDVDEKSVAGNPIVIDQIEILAPEITYEKTARDDNFHALLRNVKKQTRRAPSGDTAKTSGGGSADKGGGTKLLIRSLVIKEGRVNLTAAALAGQTVTAELPYIEIQNVGGEKNGVTPEKAFNLILAALYEQIQSPDVTAALSKGLESLGVEVKGVSVKGFEGKAQEALENVKDKVKGLLGN
jgi:uncharacterized protein involved in outer membrane biogenesis